MMTLDEAILGEAKETRSRLVELESQTAHARIDYHHAIKRLHAAGGSLREIAEALGLSHQRVHQIVDESGPPGARPFDVPPWVAQVERARKRGKHRQFFARFEGAARQAIVDAQQEAELLGHDYLGTEHLLLALVRQGIGDLGLEIEKVREQVAARVGRGAEPADPTLRRPFTSRAKRAIRRALGEATGAGRRVIVPDDLVLAIAADAKGTGGEILQALGVTPEQLRERLGR